MRSLRILAFASIIATAPVVAAGQATPAARPAAQSKPKPAPPKTTVKRAPRAPVKPAPPPQLGVTTPSGLTYVITARGKGRRPKTGETVLVHYTGTLIDGTKFDSSQDRKEPIAFPLGRGAVIKGWDEGIARMGIGDSAVLIIPPQLGYGAEGAGDVIPPNATLVFVVMLVDIKGEALSELPRRSLLFRGDAPMAIRNDESRGRSTHRTRTP
jgi:peptidylprolyl isomerase